MQVGSCLFVIFLSNFIFVRSRTVVTKSGIIHGSTANYEEKTVERFLGIPFAEPPLKELRFRKPVPVKPRLIPIQADSYPPSCMQYYPFNYPWVDKMLGKSEDCLYLNIWVPQGKQLAVMVWIYGGGFSTGSNRIPDYDGLVLAVRGDVIVVTINYRVGIFGFFSTDSDSAPGNMGFYDVLEALKWVNQNIEAFGGDKDKITVFGESAGSVLTAYLTVSPLSKGLFQRVILESAVEIPLVTLGNDPKRKNIERGQRVAESVGCASESRTIENNSQEVIECLRNKKAEDLLDAVFSVVKTSLNSFIPIHGDQILPLSLFEALKQGQVHDVGILIGNVQDEGSFILPSGHPEVFGPYGENETGINETYARRLILDSHGNFNSSNEIADHYLNNSSGNDFDARKRAYNAIGDNFYMCPNVRYAKIVSKLKENVYFYYYNHQSAVTVFAPWMGVFHSAEIPFVFGRPLDKPNNYTDEEARLSEMLVTYWSNFAKHGIPSVKWKKFTNDVSEVETLQIDENVPNNLGIHFNNCEYLSQFFF